MGFLQSDKLLAAQIAFDTRFNKAIDELRAQSANPDVSFWEKLAIEVASGTKVEQYNWFGALPQFQRWNSERKIGKLRAEKYTITNQRWANGLEVDLDDIADDRLGLYMPKIEDLAEMAIVHRTDMLVKYLIGGFSSTSVVATDDSGDLLNGACYDGQPFFSTSHSEGGGATQSNYITDALSTSGAFDKAYKTMMQMKDENGQPYYAKPSHLVCGPASRAAMNATIMVERLANGASNPNYKIVEPYISPRILDNAWFLLDLRHSMKPLIFQSREPVKFSISGFSETEQTMERFLKNKAFFGADGRYAFGYGLPQLAVGSDGTT